MFSNIVVGTDGSDTAQGAVALAVDLARQASATLHLVNVYKGRTSSVAGGIGGVAAGGDDVVYRAVSKDASEKLLADIAAEVEGVDVQTHAEAGPPADMLVKVAEEIGADVIVVGSKGMQGARRVLGSVPNSVAHNAPCHVLIAKTV
jgi:nucleotide-binding universal stress UspA family protein